MHLMRILRALADENRLRILNLLYQEPLCVCQLQVVLDLNQSNASRHLGKLSDSGLLVSEKKAQWVYYRIDPNILAEHKFLKSLFDNEFQTNTIFVEDRNRLEEHSNKGFECTRDDSCQCHN